MASYSSVSVGARAGCQDGHSRMYSQRQVSGAVLASGRDRLGWMSGSAVLRSWSPSCDRHFSETSNVQ